MRPVFLQYLDERFPVLPYTVLIAAMVAAASGAVAQQNVTPVVLGIDQALVVCLLILGFFLLRVFDEHKDYEKDLVAHPDRVLSRGLITLAQLKWAGAVAVFLQLGLALYLGGDTPIWVCVYLAFSVAMRFEFGFSDWLNRHAVVYALTHNPIVALMMITAVAVASGGQATINGVVVWWLCVASLTSLGFEIGRKVRASEDEREGQDTYTSALGIPRSMALLLVCEALALFTTLPLLDTKFAIATLCVIAVVMGGGPMCFLRRPSSKNASLVESTSTLGALGIYLLIAIESIANLGVSWT
jgi:4-hydroxybenzoate polyprenyltransferase